MAILINKRLCRFFFFAMCYQIYILSLCFAFPFAQSTEHSKGKSFLINNQRHVLSDVKFRMLEYYDFDSIKRIIPLTFGNLSADTDIRIGTNMVRFKKGEIQIYKDGQIRGGVISRDSVILCRGQNIKFKRGQIYFHSNGTIDYGQISGKNVINIMSNSLTLSHDEYIHFYPDGALYKIDLSKALYVIFVQGKPVQFPASNIGIEFHPTGILKKAIVATNTLLYAYNNVPVLLKSNMFAQFSENGMLTSQGFLVQPATYTNINEIYYLQTNRIVRFDTNGMPLHFHLGKSKTINTGIFSLPFAKGSCFGFSKEGIIWDLDTCEIDGRVTGIGKQIDRTSDVQLGIYKFKIFSNDSVYFFSDGMPSLIKSDGSSRVLFAGRRKYDVADSEDISFTRFGIIRSLMVSNNFTITANGVDLSCKMYNYWDAAATHVDLMPNGDIDSGTKEFCLTESKVISIGKRTLNLEKGTRINLNYFGQITNILLENSNVINIFDTALNTPRNTELFFHNNGNIAKFIYYSPSVSSAAHIDFNILHERIDQNVMLKFGHCDLSIKVLHDLYPDETIRSCSLKSAFLLKTDKQNMLLNNIRKAPSYNVYFTEKGICKAAFVSNTVVFYGDNAVPFSSNSTFCFDRLGKIYPPDDDIALCNPFVLSAGRHRIPFAANDVLPKRCFLPNEKIILRQMKIKCVSNASVYFGGYDIPVKKGEEIEFDVNGIPLLHNREIALADRFYYSNRGKVFSLTTNDRLYIDADGEFWEGVWALEAKRRRDYSEMNMRDDKKKDIKYSNREIMINKTWVRFSSNDRFEFNVRGELLRISLKEPLTITINSNTFSFIPGYDIGMYGNGNIRSGHITEQRIDFKNGLLNIRNSILFHSNGMIQKSSCRNGMVNIMGTMVRVSAGDNDILFDVNGNPLLSSCVEWRLNTNTEFIYKGRHYPIHASFPLYLYDNGVLSNATLCANASYQIKNIRIQASKSETYNFDGNVILTNAGIIELYDNGMPLNGFISHDTKANIGAHDFFLRAGTFIEFSPESDVTTLCLNDEFMEFAVGENRIMCTGSSGGMSAMEMRRPGRESRLQYIALYPTGALKSAVLARDVVWKAGENKWYIATAEKYNDSSDKMPWYNVWFYETGELEKATISLKRSQTKGFDFIDDTRPVSFHKNGSIAEAFITGSMAVSGETVMFKTNSPVHFYNNGNVRSGVLKEKTVISISNFSVVAAPDAELSFYDDGVLQSCNLAEPVVYDGIVFKAGYYNCIVGRSGRNIDISFVER